MHTYYKITPMKSKDFLVLCRLVTTSGAKIRVYDNSVHAGTATDAGDVEYSYEDAMALLQTDGVESFTTMVRGDCMEDAGIMDGDMVVFETRLEPQNGSIVATSIDGELLLRYFYRDERQKDVVWLVPSNGRKNYSPRRIDASTQCRLVGVVVSCIKNFRRREFGCVSRLRSSVDACRLTRYDSDASCVEGPRFVTCVVDPDRSRELIKRLHTLIDGRRGKDVAMVVRAAMKEGLISRPTYSQMVEEFGDIGNRSGFHRYLGYDYFDSELQPLCRALQEGVSESAHSQA